MDNGPWVPKTQHGSSTEVLPTNFENQYPLPDQSTDLDSTLHPIDPTDPTLTSNLKFSGFTTLTNKLESQTSDSEKTKTATKTKKKKKKKNTKTTKNNYYIKTKYSPIKLCN